MNVFMQVNRHITYFVIKAESLDEIRETVIVEFLEVLPHCCHKATLLVTSPKVGAWNTVVKKITCSILIRLQLDAKDVVRSNLQGVLDPVEHQKIRIFVYSLCCEFDLPWKCPVGNLKKKKSCLNTQRIKPVKKKKKEEAIFVFIWILHTLFSTCRILQKSTQICIFQMFDSYSLHLNVPRFMFVQYDKISQVQNPEQRKSFCIILLILHKI